MWTGSESRFTIPRETPDARRAWLVSTVKLIKYSFVPHHQHGRRASQEYDLRFSVS